MTLQIKVSKVSIATVSALNQDLLVTMNLKCWDEEDNMELNDPVVDENVECLCRSDAVGEIKEQVSSVILQIQKKMQYIINAYKIKNNLLVNESLAAQIVNIETNLKG